MPRPCDVINIASAFDVVAETEYLEERLPEVRVRAGGERLDDMLTTMSDDGPQRPIDIRPATASDSEAVLDVWRRSGAHRTVTDDAAGVALLIAGAPGALLVAVDSGTVIGTVIAGWNGWRGSIYRIAVDSAHRRRGLAHALLEAAIARLEALGARRIDAFVVKDDQLAESFWNSLPPPWGLDPLDKRRYVWSP